MDAELPRLIYLLILGAAIAGWFFAENRESLGKTARMAIAWGMIFVGFVAAYGLWEDVRGEVMPRQALVDGSGVIEVPRGPGGHFHLTLQLNGVPVEFLVDTGASAVVLTLDDAERIGLDPQNLAFIGTARTANGTVKTASAIVSDVTLEGIPFGRARVSVNGGEMDSSLLGMEFLGRLERLEISNNQLILEP